jgi:hypothetical protein
MQFSCDSLRNCCLKLSNIFSLQEETKHNTYTLHQRNGKIVYVCAVTVSETNKTKSDEVFLSLKRLKTI